MFVDRIYQSRFKELLNVKRKSAHLEMIVLHNDAPLPHTCIFARDIGMTSVTNLTR